MKRHKDIRLHLHRGKVDSRIPSGRRREIFVASLLMPRQLLALACTGAIKKDLKCSPREARKDVKEEEKNWAVESRGAARHTLAKSSRGRVTSSESILRAFNIVRATTEKCRQARPRCLLGREKPTRKRVGGRAARIDNRTGGKIPLENVREARGIRVVEGRKETKTRTETNRQTDSQTDEQTGRQAERTVGQKRG